MLEGEGLERERHHGLGLADELLHPFAKLRGKNAGGVHQSRACRNGGEQVAFAADGLLKRDELVAAGGERRERMAAPGFGEALDELLIRGGEKEDAHVEARLLELSDCLEGAVEGALASRVDGDGGGLDAVRAEVLRHGEQEGGGQVVDAVVAAVLKLADGDGLAAAGHAGHDDELHGVASVLA